MSNPREATASTAPDEAQVTRRSVLGKVIGVTAGAVGATLIGPAAASANTGDNVVAGQVTLAGTTTEVKYNGGAGFPGIVLFGNDSTYNPTTSFYPAACGGWAGAGVSAGPGGTTTGVYGYTDSGAGQGVVGFNGGFGGAGGAGVLGRANSAGVSGVRALGENGAVALRVEGVAQFTRSGRASIAKNKKYVDVTVPGGLGSGANILATLQTYRSGVWVTACRNNYPMAGKVRIYLNKVASTTSSTSVAWFVLG